MLDIVFSNRYYDIGWLYNWGALSAILTEIGSSPDVASQFERRESAAQREMERTMTRLLDIDY
jgi:hypothetical protein